MSVLHSPLTSAPLTSAPLTRDPLTSGPRSDDDSIRPIELEDLSLVAATGGHDAGRPLPAWIDEVLAQQRTVPVDPVAVPVVLSHVEEMLDVEPPTPEPDPVALAAAEERREQAIAFELGHRAGFDHGRRDGRVEGLAEGREAGRAEALAEGRAATEQVLAVVRAGLAEHELRLHAVADEVARAATELAFGIAEAVLQRELDLESDPGAAAIRRAVAALPHAGSSVSAAVVRLHPDDVETLSSGADELLVGAELTVLADAAVERGGCLLDVDATRVDASLDAALARVKEVLAP